MCGIAGTVRGDAASDADVQCAERMNAALVHRGPDDDGIYRHGPCALGARRLAVMDVEHGHQPMVSADGRYALVFNGEIYNAPELRTDLQQRGHAFLTRCDTEVLLAACIEWGDDAVDRLNGMFAYALYDREAARLTLARDRLGIKPLFFLRHNGDLYFASELDALLRSGRVSGALDAASLDAYFTYLYVPGPETIFKDVQQVRPGEQVVFENGRLTRRTWWEPAYPIEPGWTLESAAERYRELLRDAINLQRASDVPLGAFLSGGMDSASVVAALAEAQSGLETFTIGFDDPAADERAYADAVARRFGTRHTSEVMQPDLVSLLPQLVPHFGQPFADSSAVPTHLVSKRARESVTVTLSGDGGDELFAGYSWLHMTRRAHAWRRVPEPVRRLIDVLTAAGNASPMVEKVHRFNRDSFLEPRGIVQRRVSCFYTEDRAALYQPHVLGCIEQTARDRFRELWDAAAPSNDERMLRQDLRMYLPDDVLAKVDRMSMACSLEVRVPLLDHRLVEFANSLPFALKYHRGAAKRVPRYAFRDILPEAVLKPRKRGFSIPVDRWMRGPLREFVADTVFAPDSRCRAWLDPAELERIRQDHQSGRRNFGHRLWCVLAFELWLRYVAGYVDVGLE